VRRLLAPVVLALCLCGPVPAEAQVVTLRPDPGPVLVQGPLVAGDRVVWSQQRCLRDCRIFPVNDTEGLYLIRSAGAGGVPRTLFRARPSGAFSGPNFGYDTFSFLASEQALVTRRVVFSGDEVDGESARVVVRAGAPGTARSMLVDCSAPLFSGEAPAALDGNRVIYDPDPCDDLRRLVVRDLGTGATTALPESAGATLLAMRGRFAAWIEGSPPAVRLVVHDLMGGTTAYSGPAPDVLALDLDADGSVAAVSGRRSRPCATGRLLRYSVAAPGPADLGPACAVGVAIDGGRIVYLARDGLFRTLRAVAADGALRDLVRFGRVRVHGFDFLGERLTWAARDCGGGEASFTATLGEAPVGAGSINCRARFRSGVVPVRRGLGTVRLRCPRGCAGELSLRHMGRRPFSLLPGETEVRVRLRRDVWARLQRVRLLPALARMVTFNRAGDRAARSRGVTLVAR
jgi:hypothetical protein